MDTTSLSQAQWISRDKGQIAPWKNTKLTDAAKEEFAKGVPEMQGSTLYRTKFKVDTGLVSAQLEMCGLGYYDAYINGQRPDENRVLTPIPSDYYKMARLDTYDITRLLTTGDNVLGAEVCNGWFTPNKKWADSWQMTWYASPRLYARLTLTYEDGHTETIGSDETWKWAPGPVVSNCIYDGEIVDFNLEQKGWNTTAFDDAPWERAVTVEAVCDTLEPTLAPPIRIVDVLSPVCVKSLTDDTLLYDFGENHAGLPRVTVQGHCGDTLVLHHAEFLNPDGTLNPASEGSAACTDTYTLSGDVNVCHPRFTWHGYRYMTITKSSPSIEILKMESCKIHSDIATTGTFTCSRADLNQLHETYVRTELACLQGFPVDCPQRNERKAWLGDTHVTSELCLYNLDMRDFYASWLNDLRLGRIPETQRISFICPEFFSSNTSIDWNIAYPIILSEYYARYKDIDLLASHYPTLKEHTDSYVRECEDGFVKPCWFGDWFSVDYNENTEKVVFASGHEKHRQNPPFAGTMFYCQTLRLTAQIAAWLGHDEDAAHYQNLWEVSKEALVQRCYDSKLALFGSGGQFLLTYALAEHLVPEEDRDRVFVNLVKALAAEDYHMIMGVVGQHRIWEVLMEFHRPDIAYKLITTTGYPSPLHMISEDHTTLCEGLDFSGSGCHCMFASPDAVFYRILGGLTLDRTQETPLQIRPYCPDDLTYATCTQELVEGTLSIHWERIGQKILYKIDIPTGLTAQVQLEYHEITYTHTGAIGHVEITLG